LTFTGKGVKSNSEKLEVVSMPIYEFECSKGTITERFVAVGIDSIQCPCCRKKAHKIISRFSFELKGGGWYADGYASRKPSGTSSDAG
jgi:putative FmdB family regulatory protein